MLGGSRDGRVRLASAWMLSVAAHWGVASGGAYLVARSLDTGEPSPAVRRVPAPAPVAIEVELDLPVMAAGSVVDAPEAPRNEPAAVPRGGGEAAPRPDTGTRGRGGTDTAAEPAVNLADRDDGTFISAEVRSRWDRSQVQRIRSGEQRASFEDWRASREPMELTFVGMGSSASERPERRAPAKADPSSGMRVGEVAKRRGGELGRGAIPDGMGESPRQFGSAVLGAAAAAAGAGVRDGRAGDDHRASAPVASARPMVAQGDPSVPANARGKPRDTMDSEQEVAAAMRSIVHASTAGGAPGLGTGGQNAPGPSGSGGQRGAGSVARALGTGHGGPPDVDPADARRTAYVRRAMAKIHPLWRDAFPRWAAIEGLQGTVIVTFLIRADGSVASAIVTRPSGIPEFDENCRRAVLRAAPFDPLPPELGASFRWAMPFEARNPAVLPRFGGVGAELGRAPSP